MEESELKGVREKAVVNYEEDIRTNPERAKIIMFHGRNKKTVKRDYYIIGETVKPEDYGDTFKEGDIGEGQVAIHVPEQLLIKGAIHLDQSMREEDAIEKNERRFWARSPRTYSAPEAQLKKADEE